MEKPEPKPVLKKPARAQSRKPPKKDQDDVIRLRSLAHDLSNALEAILQASYLLGQSKVDGDARRWVQLIDTSSQEAARINRDFRKLLRTMADED
jgi:signal transduction histidine kinase